MLELSSETIVRMTKSHYKLQVGCYLRETYDLRGAVYSLGKYITDCYWNYASLVRSQRDQTSELIRRVENFSEVNRRKPAFYLDPSTRPADFVDILQSAGYSEEDHEIWMLHDGLADLETVCDNPEVDIELVKSKGQMSVFVEIFNTGFDMSSNEYGESLIDSFQTPPTGVEILHYLAKLGGKVCGVASLYSSGKAGGIYNVTTLPEFRRQGVGTSLNKRAVLDSLARKHELLILQTEANGDAYRIYERMGFRPGFLASIYVKG